MCAPAIAITNHQIQRQLAQSRFFALLNNYKKSVKGKVNDFRNSQTEFLKSPLTDFFQVQLEGRKNCCFYGTKAR